MLSIGMNRSISIYLGIWILALGCASQGMPIEIISAKQLMQELQTFIVIDAREDGFSKFHIPGSHSMQWKDFTLGQRGISAFLNPKIENWGLVSEDKGLIEQSLRALGISNDSKVIVVGQPNLWGTEGRIAWNLLYWGLNKVYLLNGGISAWKKENFPLNSGASKILSKKDGNFKVNFQWSRRANKAHIKNLLNTSKELRLFDIRSIDEFKGKKLSGQKRGGHLPNAQLIPFTSLYDESGYFIKKDKLQKQIGSMARSPISYCLGGVRSSLFALLYEFYFEKVVENYDGSMWEWSADSSLPLKL
jgi:thiosulfate/3-mercaptopyruvate sulfurtransferase